MKRGPLPLAAQLVLALVLPALLALGTSGYLADLATRRALEAALGDRLCSIAQAASTILGPAVLLLERGDEESRSMRNAQQKLAALIRATGVDRVLVVRTDGKALLDTARELGIGDEYARARFDSTELEAVGRGASVASVLFDGPDGQPYKTGYAPLFDEEGRVAAYVGVRARAGFYAAIDKLRMRLGGTSLVGLLLLAALAVYSARKLSVPLQELSAAAERIGAGALDTAIPGGGPREAQVLAETMRGMTRSLEKRDQEMQMMLAGIAHEVRNPLGGIELFGGLLREDLEESDPRRKHVEKILKELGTLARVVNDFLDFARRGAHQAREVELHEVLSEVVGVAEREAASGEVRLELSCPARLSAQLDPDAIKRAMLNLVQNAIQASPKGGTVKVAAEAREGALELTVSDQGPGIPADKRAEVFAPFFTTKQKGTGLGLALVKKAVDAHQGTVLATEAEGGGARFVIRLPLS